MIQTILPGNFNEGTSNNNEEIPDKYYAGLTDLRSPEKAQSRFSQHDTYEIEPHKLGNDDLVALARAGGVAASLISASYRYSQVPEDKVSDLLSQKYPQTSVSTISRRKFMAGAAAVTGASLLAFVSNPQELMVKVAESLEKADGIIAKTFSEHTINPLLGEFLSDYSKKYHSEMIKKDYRLDGLTEYIVEGKNFRTLICSAYRGDETNRVGRVYISSFNDGKAPYVTTPAQMFPGLLNSSLEYLCQNLHQIGIDTPVSLAGWCSHHAASYSQARKLKPDSIIKNGDPRRASMSYYLNPPGKKNAFGEWGYPSTPAGNSKTPVYNWYLKELGLVYPPKKSRGYPRTSTNYAIYKYKGDNWDYEVGDNEAVLSRMQKTGDEWSYFLPNLIVDNDNAESISILEDGSPNILEMQATYIAKNAEGKLICGVVSSDVSVLSTPKECWDLVFSNVNQQGLELQHIFYTDSGGSSGFAVPENVSEPYGQDYKDVHAFGRNIDTGSLKDTVIYGKRIGAAVEKAAKIFPWQHTVGQMQIYIDPKDIKRLPNYLA